MLTDCCKHLPALRRKAHNGYVYFCSRCGLECPVANSADTAKGLWEGVSDGCTITNTEHQLWKYRIGKQ